MSNINYEQKYKEALKKAKAIYCENCDACKMCIEEVFPELKEKSDEGTKVFLLDYIQSAVWSEQFPPKEEILTWIKNQDKSAIIKKITDWIDNHHKDFWEFGDDEYDSIGFNITKFLNELSKVV